MALNLDPILITIAEINVYRDLSENMDQDRIDQTIRDAQIDEMSNFLGEELYLKMILTWTGTEFPAGIFADLWDGVDYTAQGKDIRFHGLQPAISLYAYSRMLDTIQLNVTRAGVVNFDSEESEPTEQTQIASKVKAAKGQALVYLARADKFLQEHKADYPEYQTKNTDVINKTSLTIFKV